MAKIEIISRPIKTFKFLGQYAPQHLYVLHTKDSGKRIVYRGGPENGDNFKNWIRDDIGSSSAIYDKNHPDYDKLGVHTRKTLLEGTISW